MARPPCTEPLLGEWACLGLLCAAPAHGFAVAKRLAPIGDVGRVWSLSRPLTYRALDELVARGLAEPVGHEPGTAGGGRTILAATATGAALLAAWLAQPVVHVREVRAELLVKLILCDLNSVDRGPLLDAQHAVLAPVSASLHDADAIDGHRPDPVAVWRQESSRAVMRFLDRLRSAG